MKKFMKGNSNVCITVYTHTQNLPTYFNLETLRMHKPSVGALVFFGFCFFKFMQWYAYFLKTAEYQTQFKEIDSFLFEFKMHGLLVPLQRLLGR